MTSSFFVGGAYGAGKRLEEANRVEAELVITQERLAAAEQRLREYDSSRVELLDKIATKNARIAYLEQQFGGITEIAELKATIDGLDQDIAYLKAQREQHRLSEEARSEHIARLEQCNERQLRLIQTLREKSVVALLQQMRDDVEDARDTFGTTEWSRGQLLAAFDTYEKRFS